ncbi:MAG: NAD(P)-binding domain-containing protein [Caldilineaceae bacterium]|nr:NAD(P)-binding domain-containing protein [Caldilineaceae bacterium]
MNTATSFSSRENGGVYDAAIIGAGPIGIELAVCLKEAGLNYIHFDAHQIGYTMTWWPRNTNFFSTTERLAIAGIPIQNNHQQRITGEDYLAYLRGVVEQFDLAVNAYEPVTGLVRDEDGFALTTVGQDEARVYRARRVILAIGDMHNANRLDIPGEDLPHVSHYFRDPHDYFRRKLLIVGGKNSAAEAALRCWRIGGQVAVSYRRAEFDDRKVKHWILPDLLAQIEAGCQAVQVFDSWAGCLCPADFKRYVLPYTQKLIDQIPEETPVINFLTGNPSLLPMQVQAGGQVIGIDWRMDLGEAWRTIVYDRAIQGNLDPVVIYGDYPFMRERVIDVLDAAEGRPGHIFNLGHGVHPDMNPDHVKELVKMVHELGAH